MIKASQFTFILLILTVLSSCNTHKRMVYFQTEQSAEAGNNAHFTPTLKTDDFLSVVITADDVESVIPFNYPVVGVTQSVNQGYSQGRSEEHTSELQSRPHLVCRLLLEKKKKYSKE